MELCREKVGHYSLQFPPDKGTPAYLNVFSSIYSILKDLKKDGYNVEGLPKTSKALIEETPYATLLEENWGKPPGNLNLDGNLLVYGKLYDNVLIGVQPTFGYEGDPMRLLFSKSASPHHGLAAYYSFVEKIFEVDAVLHFDTHGSLEFKLGRQRLHYLINFWVYIVVELIYILLNA
ncbi:hypothetical protein Dimus_032514 [Dionaea muscipula]